MKKTVFTVLVGTGLCLAGAYQSFGQKVMGYIDGNLSGAVSNAQNLNWNKMTDIIYGFVQPSNNSGALEAAPASFSSIKALAEQNSVRIHLSSGGANWTIDQRFSAIAGSAPSRNTYATNIANFIITNDLDGFDLDWEFPNGETANHVLLCQAIRTEIDRAETVLGKEVTFAIAVGGETDNQGVNQGAYHTDYVSPDAFQYIDYLNLMAYDYGASFDINHSYYDGALANINAYAAMGCPKEKMVLGVPFYGRTSGRGAWARYNQATNFPAAFNNDNFSDGFSTHYHNGRATMENKIDLIMNEGGIGIFIWEITYDRNDQYSLLTAIYDYMETNYGIDNNAKCTSPDLGQDIALCAVGGSFNAESNISEESYRTFSWTRNGNPIGTNQNSLLITQTGTYIVTVDSGGVCSETDELIVTENDLPAPDLGEDIELCEITSAILYSDILDPVNSYSWERNGVTIAGANTTYLEVSEAGTYTLLLSTGSCTPSTDDVIVTSLLVDVNDQSVCSGSSTDLVINSISDDFDWYTTSENGSPFHSGNIYSTPNLSATATYYIEDNSGGGSGGSCSGINEWSSGQTYQRAQASQEITVVFQENLYRMINGVWWSANNQPDIFTNIWELQGPCGNACARTPVNVTVEVCTNIDESSDLNYFEFYPNPASDLLHIRKDGNFEIILSSIEGKTIRTLSGQDTLDLSINDLKQGTYYISVISEVGTSSSTFVKH